MANSSRGKKTEGAGPLESKEELFMETGQSPIRGFQKGTENAVILVGGFHRILVAGGFRQGKRGSAPDL